MRAQNIGSAFEFSQESRAQRHFDFVRRWTYGLERRRRYRISSVRIPMLHFASDLKKIYTAHDEPLVARIRDELSLNGQMRSSRRTNWKAIVPIFKFSPTLRTIVYTTNTIESLNATYSQLNHQRSVFPNDTALLKALFLATDLVKKK